MAPLPPIWDPSAAIDKLPQPFRLVDKLVAEIVERALKVVVKNDLQRKKVEAAKIDLVSVITLNNVHLAAPTVGAPR